MAAGREKGEEVLGVNAGELRPLGDRFRVDDPRYRQGKDKIFSRLFACTYRGGDPVGADDIKTVRWFDRQELRDVIAPWHMPHVEQLEAYWSGRQTARPKKKAPPLTKGRRLFFQHLSNAHPP